ncbi:ABC transporter substrate-binding protein [Streptomyces sp. NPDC014986]|uniref:ABC transporter substrate-binding protein n=1 Tax=Streptomyces sp. NPDC014986 TaxID=3364934 RepID=UPI0036FB61DC
MPMTIRPPRPRWLFASVTVAALLMTAACSGDDPDSPDSSQKATRLSLSIQGAPASFEPTRIDAGQSSYVWRALYDTLLHIGNDGRLQPNAAQRYAYSADRRTLTLTLRKGMTFSSGAPVNAAAVKATLERIRDTPGPNQANIADAVASVDAPDDLTVVVGLKHPSGSLLWNLAGVNGVIADPATMARSSTATDPVGSGPYTLDKGATVNGSEYTLKKREDHWNADAYPFGTVRVRVMGDRAAVVNALRAGELNAGSVDPTQVEPLKSAGLRISPVKAFTVGNLVLADRAGASLEPLGDVRVRRAINMAFDRTKLVAAFLKGVGVPSTQLFNPKGQAYDARLDKAYPFDVAAARKLMAEAGYAQGFSVKMPSFVTTKPFEPVIAQSLAAIGIKVTWEAVPIQRQATTLAAAKYPMYFVIYGLDTDAVLTTLYTTPGTPTNPFKSSDPKLTELIDEANRAGDPAGAGAAYKEINKFFVDNAWFAPLMDIGVTWVTGKGVEHLGDGSSTAIDIRNFGTAG